MWLEKARSISSASSASATCIVNADKHPGASLVGAPKSGGWSTLLEQPQCCGCGENHTVNCLGCVK